MKHACRTTFASLRGAMLFTVLASFSGAQNQTWIRQFGTGGTDIAWAAAPDGAGGVFVSGYTNGSLGGPNAGANDAWLAHYDSAGNQDWIRQFGSAVHDNLFGAALDGAGGVFMAGHTQGSLGGPNAGDTYALLAHYDDSGNQTWMRQLGTSRDDVAWAAAPDGAGGVFAIGNSLGSLGGPNAGCHDAWIARYDGTGSQTWIRQFGSQACDYAWAATHSARENASCEEGADECTRKKRVPWSELLDRVFGVDILRCPRCGGRRHMIAQITDPFAVRKVLGHLGLRTEPLELSLARPPTQTRFA